MKAAPPATNEAIATHGGWAARASGIQLQADDRQDDAGGEVQGDAECPVGYLDGLRAERADQAPGSRQDRKRHDQGEAFEGRGPPDGS
jgi:hypothetical protein